MLTAPGDIAWAFAKPRAPRWRISFRFGVQRLVLRLSPLSFTDEYGNDWIDVLPARRNIDEVRVDPDAIVLIPAADVVKPYSALTPEAFGALLEVLRGNDPRYPWLTPYDEEGRVTRAVPTPPPRPPGADFPTIREILDHRDRAPPNPAPDAGDEPG